MNGNVLKADAFIPALGWSWRGVKNISFAFGSNEYWLGLLAFGLPIAPGLRVLILCLGALVLAAECFNTAIERVVNHLSPGQHPLAKAAKDAGSAGVALTAGAAGVAWVFALWGLL